MDGYDGYGLIIVLKEDGSMVISYGFQWFYWHQSGANVGGGGGGGLEVMGGEPLFTLTS